MFIVVSVSMLSKLRLGVLGVAKLLMTVFMCMLCVLRGVHARTSVCEYDIRVFAYHQYIKILVVRASVRLCVTDVGVVIL